MGKKRTGVSKGSANSIVINFTYQGIKCRPRVWGKPTEANLAAALKFRNRILDAIEDGTFDYATTFPKDKQRYLFNPTSAIKVKQYLTEWYEGHKHNYADSSLEKNQLIIDNQLIPAFLLRTLPLNFLPYKGLTEIISSSTASSNA